MSFSLGALAGGVSSGLSAETQQALQRLQAQAMRDSQQSSQQAGQILSQLYGGPTGQPQQSGGLGGMLRGLLGGSQQPSSQPQGPPALPPGGQQGAPQGGQQPSPPQPSMQRPQGQSQPAATPPQVPSGPPGPGQIQMMQLPDIVAAAKRVNPNMTPQQLMSAIDRLQPLMNAQALQQYRMVQMQLGAGRLNETVRRDDLQHEDRGAALTEKKSEFERRQESMASRFKQTLDEKIAALGQAKDIAERRNIVTSAEAAIKDSLAATRAEIGAANVTGPERTQLMKEAAQAADAARERVAETAKVKQSSDANQSTAPKKTTSDAPVRQEGQLKTGAQPAQAPIDMIRDAKEAIAQGAPREDVIKILKTRGVDPALLDR